MKFWIIVGVLVIGFVGYFVFVAPKNTTPYVSPANALSSMVGKPAPDFTLSSYNGTTTTLSKLRGKKVVLFFNEGIMCYPACWNQIAALGTDNSLNNNQVATASIVTDGPDDWIKAVRKEPDLSKETILLDSDTSVSQHYNMLEQPSSMHKGMKPGHTYVVIDQKGIARYVYDDAGMAIQNDRLKKELAKI